jgi:LysM repeat protein
MAMKKLRISIFVIATAVLIITSLTTSFALNGSKSYTVKKGDSLYTVGKNNNVTTQALLQANGMTTNTIYPGQVLQIPVKVQSSIKTPTAVIKPLSDILKEKGIIDPSAKFSIFVDKSEHVLSVYWGSTFLKSYHVELGSGGLAAKQKLGDYKTPEGKYYITEKLVYNPADEYLGTRWMRLSYPNIQDADRGLQQGIINQQTHDAIVDAINNKLMPPQDTALGGAVGVHGGSTAAFGSDWTWGCVGLKSSDVEDFYQYVRVGTPVVIQQ